MKNHIFYCVIICTGLIVSCKEKPRVIVAESVTTEEAPVFQNVAIPLTDKFAEHKVKVVEALNTSRYTYLSVEEADQKFWIAIPKREVTIGNYYTYTGGLLKKNFQSTEYDRVFETVYLVSGIRDVSEHPGNSVVDQALAGFGNNESTSRVKVQLTEGTVSIAELFAHPEKYDGKTIAVSGKCIKVNTMIMKRNWVHIQDSSSDQLDLTVTTVENIAVDQEVTLQGVIAIDKDFGAGYKYDIIMEGAILL